MLKSSNIKTLIRHMLLSGVAPAVTGILIVILATQYIQTTWQTVLVTIGSVLIGVGVFDVVFRFVAFQHFVDHISSTVLRALRLPIRTFYESRSHLDSVEHELSGVKEIWAAWHIGPYRDFEAFFPQGRQGKILLTDPASSVLRELCKIRKSDVECMTGVIRNITRHALEKKLEVRWFDGPICNNVIIADPLKDRAWMRVELMLPIESPQKRPSFLVDKEANRGLYDTFDSAFQKMWQASRVPDIGPVKSENEQTFDGYNNLVKTETDLIKTL